MYNNIISYVKPKLHGPLSEVFLCPDASQEDPSHPKEKERRKDARAVVIKMLENLNICQDKAN